MVGELCFASMKVHTVSERRGKRKVRRHTGIGVQPQLSSTMTAQIGKKDRLCASALVDEEQDEATYSTSRQDRSSIEAVVQRYDVTLWCVSIHALSTIGWKRELKGLECRRGANQGRGREAIEKRTN